MEILISVILPVYNAERYVERAIESVTAQMTDDMELILVDDGSTDGSGAICDRYAHGNFGVQVIHQANKGASAARNAGLARARGTYVSFVDSDDTVSRQAYETIRPCLLEQKPDLLDFGWQYVTFQGETSRNHHRFPKNTLLDENFIHQHILPPFLNLRKGRQINIYPFLWNKVFRRSIFTDNQIWFWEDCRLWEDKPVIVQFLSHCNSYYSMDACLYTYHGIPGSLSSQYDARFFHILLSTFQTYTELFGDRYDFDTPYANAFYCKLVEQLIFRSLKQQENQEEILQNILYALSNEQIIHWYANRGYCNSMEKKATAFVTDRCPRQALQVYMNATEAQNRRNCLDKIKEKICRIVRR